MLGNDYFLWSDQADFGLIRFPVVDLVRKNFISKNFVRYKPKCTWIIIVGITGWHTVPERHPYWVERG